MGPRRRSTFFYKTNLLQGNWHAFSQFARCRIVIIREDWFVKSRVADTSCVAIPEELRPDPEKKMVIAKTSMSLVDQLSSRCSDLHLETSYSSFGEFTLSFLIQPDTAQWAPHHQRSPEAPRESIPLALRDPRSLLRRRDANRSPRPKLNRWEMAQRMTVE